MIRVTTIVSSPGGGCKQSFAAIQLGPEPFQEARHPAKKHTVNGQKPHSFRCVCFSAGFFSLWSTLPWHKSSSMGCRGICQFADWRSGAGYFKAFAEGCNSQVQVARSCYLRSARPGLLHRKLSTA